jgi:hypothetical protein
MNLPLWNACALNGFTWVLIRDISLSFLGLMMMASQALFVGHNLVPNLLFEYSGTKFTD